MRDQIPTAPEAPPHLSAEEASAWQSGWESGYAAFHRAQLVEEFTSLRNAKLRQPPASNTRLRNIYFDHLNETDALARLKSDAELAAAIDRMKAA